MPTALFIPEEHNCCYRYSYSGTLQTPAALPQLIIQCSIYTVYTHTYTATFGPHHPNSKRFLCLSRWWAATGRQSWRAHLSHWAACQQALTHAHYITTAPVLNPAPNHYAHNHLMGKQNVEYAWRMTAFTDRDGKKTELRTWSSHYVGAQLHNFKNISLRSQLVVSLLI